ncbi:hypothetical protein [Pendulispora albinea]|uniref:Porin n=1 Tax=Pendulispora albinea TaxID=2741071 RepID=A0ABZ2LVC4_9BACT
MVAVAGPSGFGVESADGDYRLRLHWLLQTDYQAFLVDRPPGVTASSTFNVRFAALQMSAVVARRFRSQMFVDFAQGRLTLLDAWLEVDLARPLTLRVGKFLYPISEERLTPGIWLPFVSTTLASVLLPARDTGLQLYGEPIPGVLKYNVALTNGGSAGLLGDADIDAHRELTARVFGRPFAWLSPGPLTKLGLGIGASYTEHDGTVAAPELPILRTYGGQTFFAYKNDRTAAGTMTARGAAWRIVPHATWAFGPVAAYVDWVHASDDIGTATVSYDALGAVASLVLTGEDAEPLSYIVPKRPLDLAKGHLGTFLLVGGAGRLIVGSSAFRAGAVDPSAGSRITTVYGGGLNWYPVRGIAMLGSFGHMFFESFAGAPIRPDENVLIVRMQMAI